MQKATIIDYEIVDKNNYIHQQGSIDNIKKKKTTDVWLSEIQLKSIVIQFKFHKKSLIQSIEIKSYHTPNIILEFRNDNNFIFKQQIKFDPKINDKCQIIKLDDRYLVSNVHMTLSSQISRKIGLNYIIFKGYPIEYNEKIKNLTKNQQIGSHRIIKKDQQKKSIQKKKKHDSDQSYQQKNMKQKQTRNKKDQQYQQELAQAIRISKEYTMINAQQMELQKQPLSKIKQKQILYNECKVKVFHPEQKKIFNCVNAGWLAAQQRMEQSLKIEPKMRLSKHIKVKHLYGKSIFLAQFTEKQKKELQQKIQQMGGKIINNPKDYCLIISPSKFNVKEINIQKMHGIKILKPAFINDCYHRSTLMNQQQYLIKL